MAEGTMFCTGHTSMTINELVSYTSLIRTEFLDEYKMAHGMMVKKGPGRAKMHDWAAARWDPIPLPITGCAAAKVYPGGRPPRFSKGMYSSSSMVGGWWNDELFKELTRTRGTPLPALPAVGQGKSTSSQLGSFWHDKHMYGPDLNNQELRSRNGIMRLLPIETDSKFALEDLPTADRLL